MIKPFASSSVPNSNKTTGKLKSTTSFESDRRDTEKALEGTVIYSSNFTRYMTYYEVSSKTSIT